MILQTSIWVQHLFFVFVFKFHFRAVDLRRIVFTDKLLIFTSLWTLIARVMLHSWGLMGVLLSKMSWYFTLFVSLNIYDAVFKGKAPKWDNEQKKALLKYIFLICSVALFKNENFTFFLFLLLFIWHIVGNKKLAFYTQLKHNIIIFYFIDRTLSKKKNQRVYNAHTSNLFSFSKLNNFMFIVTGWLETKSKT